MSKRKITLLVIILIGVLGINMIVKAQEKVTLYNDSEIIFESSQSTNNLKTISIPINTEKVLKLDSSYDLENFTYISEDKSGDIEVVPNLANREIKITIKSGKSGSHIFSLKKGNIRITLGFIINNINFETPINVTEIKITPIYSGINKYLISDFKINKKADVKVYLNNKRTGEKYATYIVKKDDTSYYFDRNINMVDDNTELELEILANGRKIQTLPTFKGILTEESKQDFKLTLDNTKIMFNKIVKEVPLAKIEELKITPIYSGTNKYLIGSLKTNQNTNLTINLVNKSTGEKHGTFTLKKDDTNYYFDRNLNMMEDNTEFEIEVLDNGKKLNVSNLSGELREESKKDFKLTLNNNGFTFSKIIKREELAKIEELTITPIYSGTNKYLIGSVRTNKDTNLTINLINKKTSEKYGTFTLKRNNSNYYFDRNLNMMSDNTEFEIEVLDNGKKLNVSNLSGLLFEESKKDFKLTLNNNGFIFNKIEKEEPLAIIEELKITPIYSGENKYLIGNIRTNKDTNLTVNLINKKTIEKHGTFILRRDNRNYYFDRNLNMMQDDMEFEIEVLDNGKKLNVSNLSGELREESKRDFKLTLNNNSFKFNKTTSREVYRSIKNLKIFRSSDKDYISGILELYEIIDGKKVPITLDYRNIKFVDQNGTKSGVFIKQQNDLGQNMYYFDRNISGMQLPLTFSFELDEYKIIAEGNIENNNYRLNLSKSGNEFTVKRVEVETGVYGKSGRGRDLRYYKIGNGKNVFFSTFAIHGWEDNFANDGKVLVYIADEFKRILNTNTYDYINDWTIYIFPEANPDAIYEGYTHNGPGRTTVTSDYGRGVDLNRVWQINNNYRKFTSDRNFNGNSGFGANEARYLRDFLLNNQSKTGKNILVDLHGWLETTIGDNELGSYYRNEYGMSKHISTYGDGYLVNWARSILNNSRAVLVELPKNVWSHQDAINQQLSGKFINATLNLLRNLR